MGPVQKNQTTSDLYSLYHALTNICIDNRPEYIDQAEKRWYKNSRTRTANTYIEPGSIFHNGFLVSFKSWIRDKLLNSRLFAMLSVEAQLSAEIYGLTKTVNECKEEFLRFRSDVSVLRTSHKYIVWISGGVATMCLSVIALCIPIFLHTLK